MSKVSIPVKHLPLFIAGILTFKVDGFDEGESFPNLSEKILNTDLNSVKQFIEKNWLGQGFKAFVTVAKANFGLEPDEKLTPQMWADAVTSFKVGKGSVSLQVDANDGEELDTKRSYSGAMNLAGTILSFAKHLEPAYFAECDTVEDFLQLLPAAPEQVTEAITTAQEPVATAEAPAAPEQEIPATVVPTTPVAEKAPVVANKEVAVTAATPNVGLAQIVKVFNDQDEVLNSADARLSQLEDQLRNDRKQTLAEIRESNRKVRTALVAMLTGEEVEVAALEAENV